MNIIVLAAGMGTRLYPLTKDLPKMLIEIENGTTLIDKQIQLFVESGVVDEIIYVIGYRAEMIEQKLSDIAAETSIKFRTIYNPFYDSSNNLISLWLARNEIESEVIITNGDNLFFPDVFRRIDKIKDPGIFISVLEKDYYDEDDMKVIRDEKGLLQSIGKTIDKDKCNAESVGLAKIQGDDDIAKFVHSLEQLVRGEPGLNSFWLETFNHLSLNGTSVATIDILEANEWQEIDFHLDLIRAKELIKQRIQNLKR